jgi:hypothetical protein
VRLSDPVLIAYARRVAAELDPGMPTVPVDAVEEGIALVSTADRRRLIEGWATSYPDRWEAIVGLVGDTDLAERAVVAGTVRVTILDHRRLPAAAFAPLEGGTFRKLPANALTLLVPPQAVWSMDEACVTLRLLPRSDVFNPAWFEAVERHGEGCVGPEHVERLRRAGARLATQLPLHGMPRATATLREGIRVIDTDEGWAEAIAVRLLALYASLPAPAAELRAKAR